MYLLAFARLARLATALQRSCQFADHTPNLEWSGPSLAASSGSNQPDVLQGIMTVDIAMSHVGCHVLPGLVGHGDPPASGGGQPTMIQEPNTNCLPGSGCAILGNASTMCPNVGTTETAAICSRACEADPGCGAFTWHAPHAPNPLTWQKQCFLIKRTLPMMKCYPEPLHDSGVKGYGSICSPLYHSQDQTPEHMTGRKECIKDCDCNGVPCGEYIWDHRNASLREWLVNEHVMGASSGGTDGMANPNVTGFYFDDYWSESGEGWSHGPSGLPPPTRPNLNDCKTGPSEIQIDCLKDMGLTNQDVLDLNAGWRKTTASAMRAVAKAGGWVWQMFSGLSAPADSGPTCAVGYHRACAKLRTDMNRMDLWLKDPHAPGSVLDAASDVARFLLLRGTHSFLGTAWVGCEPDNGVEGEDAQEFQDVKPEFQWKLF
eukprot:gene17387-11685_t